MTWIKPDLALTGTSLQMTPEPAGAAVSRCLGCRLKTVRQFLPMVENLVEGCSLSVINFQLK